MLKIGIDFDGTISADYATFEKVILAFLGAGHEVAIVTWRPPEAKQEIEAFFARIGFKVPVHYCNGQAKREFYKADIWIDDNPVSASFGLLREPHFRKDEYQNDVLVCKTEGYSPVYAVWGQLDPKGEANA